jgi:threonine/homoserine/homoserine lactone efflux protein
MFATVLLGFVFGFFGSVPLAGPISFLVLGRGLARRFRGGFFTAVGAALAEAIYACLAWIGLSAWLEGHPSIITASRIAAIVILVGLGIVFLRAPAPASQAAAEDADDRALPSLAIGFTLTALNPTLIANWTAAMTVLFSTGYVPFEPRLGPLFAAAVAAGITAWFATMLAILRRYGRAFRPETIRKVTRGMGVGVLVLAAAFAVSLLR